MPLPSLGNYKLDNEMISVRQSVRECSLKDDLTVVTKSGVSLWWLGQAGFLLSCNGIYIVVDPYLSDSLALKYKGREFSHRRMIPPPLAPDDVFGVKWVFCTHAHSDHMDPGTLPSLARNNPACRFLVPRAEASTAVARGIPEDRLDLVDGNETLDLGNGLLVNVLPSAHEELAQDDQGHFRFLGYCLRMGGITFYHSGDCIPYAGLDNALARLGVDVALLPVNGRDDYRLSRNVPGNFSITEAIALCQQAGVPVLLAHHWGMFDFNTVPEDGLKSAAALAGPTVNVIIPDTRVRYEFSLTSESVAASNCGESERI